MTGGMAFVLDVRGDFERRVNRDSVMIGRLRSAWWETQLKALIAEHAVATGSKWADEILDNWDRYRDQIWQVCPKEMIGRLAHPLEDEPVAEVAAAE
jgi:glutamate synthase (NADPH/NADH) large chain